MKFQFNRAMEGAVIVSLMILSACATPAGRSGRVGLLDRTEGSRGVAGNRIHTVDEKDLVEAPDPDAVLVLNGEWQWPLKNVEASSPFGERGRKFHQGVDLRAPMGTPVYAAADGTVVYVGSKIRGYGRMIVLKHEGNVYTVYAHHSKNIARAGRTVARGDLIAYSGKSGHSSGPHLHFEIRRGTTSFDPILAINNAISNHSVDRRFASVDTQSRKKKSKRGSRKATRAQSKQSQRTPKTASVDKTASKNL